MDKQASEGLIVPLRQVNGLPRPGTWTGKGASGQRSAGGKHGGYSRSRFRVNATTADSGACAASPADGIHFPEPPPRLHLAARGLLGHAPGRRHWCGRDNRCGLRSGPDGQSAFASGPSQVRYLPGTAGAKGAYLERTRVEGDSANRDTNAGGQGSPAGDRHAAATDLRAGLQALLLRVSARAIGTPGPGRPTATTDEEREWMDLGSGHPEVLRSRMLIPLLKTQLLELPSPQLLELGYCPRLVREQEEVRGRIASDRDRAIVNPVINPVRRDPHFAGDLGHGQEAGNVTRMGLAALAEQPMM